MMFTIIPFELKGDRYKSIGMYFTYQNENIMSEHTMYINTIRTIKTITKQI